MHACFKVWFCAGPTHPHPTPSASASQPAHLCEVGQRADVVDVEMRDDQRVNQLREATGTGQQPKLGEAPRVPASGMIADVCVRVLWHPPFRDALSVTAQHVTSEPPREAPKPLEKPRLHCGRRT